MTNHRVLVTDTLAKTGLDILRKADDVRLDEVARNAGQCRAQDRALHRRRLRVTTDEMQHPQRLQRTSRGVTRH